MADQTLEPLTMDIDLSGAEIGFPVFPAGAVRARIKSVGLKDSKKGGQNIAVVFTSEQELTTLGGVTRPPGVPFTMYIPNQKSKKSPDWDWEKNRRDRLAEVMAAAQGVKALAPNSTFQTDAVIGKEVVIRLGLDDSDGTQSNSIKGVLPLPS